MNPHEQVVAALDAERREAAELGDRYGVDRISFLLAQLTTRQARRLAADAQRVALEMRLRPHEVVVTDERTADVQP